jgi:hypothetical protein
MPTRREFLGAAAALAERRVRLAETKGEKVTASCDGVTLFEYRYGADRPKPYIHPLCLPGGKPITLDAPKDHVHHRGLMAAWSEVNGIDFWGEVNPAPHGRIDHQRFERLIEGSVAQLVAINHWTADGKLLLEERRIVTAPPPGEDGVWLEWVTELKAAGGAVKLGAGKHVYNGLGLRVIPEMDGGGVVNSLGSR